MWVGGLTESNPDDTPKIMWVNIKPDKLETFDLRENGGELLKENTLDLKFRCGPTPCVPSGW